MNWKTRKKGNNVFCMLKYYASQGFLSLSQHSSGSLELIIYKDIQTVSVSETRLLESRSTLFNSDTKLDLFQFPESQGIPKLWFGQKNGHIQTH